MKKVEEVEKIGYGTTVIKKSFIDPSIPSIILPNLKLPCFRSLKMISLDDGDCSDVSADRKTRNSARWSRRGSTENPLKRPSLLAIPSNNEEWSCSPPQKHSRPLSRFASPLLPKKTSSDFAFDNLVRKASIQKTGKIPKELLEAISKVSLISFKYEGNEKQVEKSGNNN